MNPKTEFPTRTATCDKHGEYASKNFFGSIWSTCPACTNEARQEAERAREKQEQERRLSAWRQKIDHSGIPPRFSKRTLDNYRAESDGQRKALDFASEYEYVSQFDEVLRAGRSAVFVGKPGTGETHLAAGIALDLLAKGYTALFSTTYAAIRRVKATWSREAEETEQQAIDALVAPDLLILDEVGVQFGSETEKLILFDVLNTRYEYRLPVLLLSNLPAPEVMQYLGQRIVDRLREDGGRVITFDWPSARGQIVETATAPSVPPEFPGPLTTRNLCLAATNDDAEHAPTAKGVR